MQPNESVSHIQVTLHRLSMRFKNMCVFMNKPYLCVDIIKIIEKEGYEFERTRNIWKNIERGRNDIVIILSKIKEIFKN